MLLKSFNMEMCKTVASQGVPRFSFRAASLANHSAQGPWCRLSNLVPTLFQAPWWLADCTPLPSHPHTPELSRALQNTMQSLPQPWRLNVSSEQVQRKRKEETRGREQPTLLCPALPWPSISLPVSSSSEQLACDSLRPASSLRAASGSG